MAIEEFGQSLLQQQRDRNRRIRKDKEKAAYIGTGVTILKKLANTFLEEKTRNFLQREDYQSARQVARGADNAKAFELDYRKRVQDSGKTEYQYELELAKPIAQQYVQEQNPMAQGKQFDALVNEMASTVARKKLGLITEIRTISQQAPESGSYTNRLDLIQKRLRPSNIEQGVTSFLRGMVDGMSNEDMELRQLAALKEYSTPEIEGPSGTITLSEAEQAKRLNSLMNMYGRTRNLTLSTNYADNEAAAEAINKRIKELPDGSKTEEGTVTANVNGQQVTFIVKKKTMADGSSTFVGEPREFNERSEKDLSVLQKETIDKMVFVAVNYFDRDVRNKFFAGLGQEREIENPDGGEPTVLKGINGLNAQTPEDFARMQYDFSLLAGNVENYAKDDSLAENQAAILKLITQLTTNELFKTFPATMRGEDPQAIGRLATNMAKFINNFQIELMGDAQIGGTDEF